MKDIVFSDIKSLQRYHHVITLNSETGYNSTSLLQRVKLKVKERTGINTGEVDFVIERAQFLSDNAFHVGEQGNIDYSKNKDGKAPFLYDVFVISMHTPAILILACPFLSLTRYIVSQLLTDKTFWSKTAFMRSDIDMLLKQSNEEDIVHHEYSCHFSRLDLSLSGDSVLKMVSLDGERPLDSPLFKDVFRPLVTQNKCRLESCALQGTVNSEDIRIPHSNSLVHVDSFGNYKLYVHALGKSLFALPFLFSFLETRKCLHNISSDPLKRIRNGQS